MQNSYQINRLQQILIIILIVQIGLMVIVFWPQTASSQTGGPLLAEVVPDEVVELTLSDSAGQSINLTKKNNSWVMSDADDYPVIGENVTTLLEKIEGVNTNRLITKTDASHDRLQVADDNFNRRLDLTLADGSTHALFIGSSGGASAAHVRAAGRDEVYLTSELAAFDANTQAASWVDTLYFSLPQTGTVSITLENENGRFSFNQVNESWTLAGLTGDELFNQNTFSTMLNQISAVRLTEPVGTEPEDSFGMDNPTATVRIETADETFTLNLGSQDPSDNSYILKASNSPYYVKVAQFTGSNLADKSRADFLQPTPEADGVISPSE